MGLKINYQHEEINTGDIISFGHYTLEERSWEYSPIEWFVLAKEEARILLLSRYGLDTSHTITIGKVSPCRLTITIMKALTGESVHCANG